MRTRKTRLAGFIFFEIVIVAAIIGVLAAIALPAYKVYENRAIAAEAFSIVPIIREEIEDYYAHHGRFPADNRALRLQPPDKIFTHYIKEVSVEEGAIHVHFRDSLSTDLAGKRLSFQPTLSEHQPQGPIVWICGKSSINGRTLIGSNYTDMASEALSRMCRES